MASNIQLHDLLSPSLVADTDITFIQVQRDIDRLPILAVCPQYSSVAFFWPPKGEGATAGFLFRLSQCDVLRFSDAMDFYVSQDVIACRFLSSIDGATIWYNLLSVALPYWLELRGVRILHATTVATRGGAVALLGDSGKGKSTLAAALMQHGLALVSDDVSPLEEELGRFYVRPGAPLLRLEATALQAFMPAGGNFEPFLPGATRLNVPVGAMHFGRYCTQRQSLTAIYWLDSYEPFIDDPQITISPVHPREAVITLVARSSIPYVLAAIGLQPARLDFFTRVVRQISVRRLRFPHGLQYLEQVCDTVIDDIDRTL